MKNFFGHFLWFVILLMIQILIFDQIHFLGIFIPLIYIYAILRLPTDMPVNAVLLVSFATGMIMDIFSNTPGMHTFSTTLMGALRYPVLRLFVLKEDLGSRNVSVSWLGGTFWKYSVLLVLIHHISLFLIESFTLFDITQLLLKIPVCSLLTMLFVFAFENINRKEDDRRS